MTAQIRNASLSQNQADVVDRLADQLGGVSKAVRHIIDFYILWHENAPTEPDTDDTSVAIETPIF